MKFSTKIILGVLAFVALCLVYYSDDYFSQKKAEKKEELSKALFFKAADVRQFTLKNASGSFVFMREINTSDWKMLEPQQVGADQRVISNVIAALNQINIQQELPGTENILKKDKSTLKQFGLDNPSVIVSVTLFNHKTETLEIGSGIEIGNKVAGKLESVSVYGLNLNRPEVLVLDAASVNSFKKKNFGDFRTKDVATFKINDVAAISINTNDKNKPDNILLEKKQKKINKIIKKAQPRGVPKKPLKSLFAIVKVTDIFSPLKFI